LCIRTFVLFDGPYVFVLHIRMFQLIGIRHEELYLSFDRQMFRVCIRGSDAFRVLHLISHAVYEISCAIDVGRLLSGTLCSVILATPTGDGAGDC
jgi:hypothetical protein